MDDCRRTCVTFWSYRRAGVTARLTCTVIISTEWCICFFFKKSICHEKIAFKTRNKPMGGKSVEQQTKTNKNKTKNKYFCKELRGLRILRPLLQSVLFFKFITTIGPIWKKIVGDINLFPLRFILIKDMTSSRKENVTMLVVFTWWQHDHDKKCFFSSSNTRQNEHFSILCNWINKTNCTRNDRRRNSVQIERAKWSLWVAVIFPSVWGRLVGYLCCTPTNTIVHVVGANLTFQNVF